MGLINFNRFVKLEKQQEADWCWAQVLSVVSCHQRGDAGWQPCQIVSKKIRDEPMNINLPASKIASNCNCCAKLKPNSCKNANSIGVIGRSFAMLGMQGNYVAGAPSQANIKTEIDAGRPIICGFVSGNIATDVGHVGLIIGYTNPPIAANPLQTLQIYDPSMQLTILRNVANMTTCTADMAYNQLSNGYPKANWSFSFHYINVSNNPAVVIAPAPPDWAKYA